MRTVKIETLISKSIQRTSLILFKPFVLKKWLCLLLIAFLAGAIGSGGNGGGGGGKNAKKADAQVQQTAPQKLSPQNGFTAMANPENIWSRLSTKVLVILPIGIGIALIMLFFLWLGARFKLIWFNALITNDASIKKPFSQYKKEGNSLFKFSLVFMGIGVCFLALVTLWGYASLMANGVFGDGFQWSFQAAINMFLAPALTLVFGIALFAVISIYIEHFVVTIMGLEKITFMPAWGMFRKVAGRNKKDFLLYFLVLIGLGIAAAIIKAIIGIALLLLVLLIAALLFGLPYLIAIVFLKVNVIFFYIFAALFGIPAGLIAIILFLSVDLPFAVFFRTFSMYFLSSLNSGFVPLPLEDERLEGPVPPATA